MSLQDRLTSYPPLSLLSIGTTLALSSMATSRNYIYNFPLLLFGLVAHELQSSSHLLQQFISLLVISGFFDVLALLGTSDGLFARIFAIAVCALKVPIGLTCANLVRERGGEVRVGGWMPQGGLGGGAGSNWTMPSMPGGFGGSSNAQAQAQAQGHATSGQPSAGGVYVPPGAGGATASQFPSTGGFRLGGDDDSTPSGPPAAPAPGRNGYSSIA